MRSAACSARVVWIEAIIFAVVILAVGWFYCWSARTEDSTWRFGQRQTDYDNLLVEGMLAGHLSLNAEVPPELLAVRDPYDPAQRPPGIALHDASLFRGKYYLYFGVAPVVTLLLPFRVVTGVGLPLPAAVVIFGYAGFLFSAAIWWAVRRRYFPHVGIVFSGLTLLALATANLVPVLMRRPNIWELPVSSGYFFASVFFLAAYWAIHGRRRLTWLAVASLSLGLAVASRPPLLFGAGGLAVLLLWMWRQASRDSASSQVRFRQRGQAAAAPPILRAVGAAVLPLAVVGVGLATYNYARFGSVTEFGMNYQLSGIYEGRARHFSWSYLPYNLRMYGFAPLDWSRYFPFLHATKPPTGPAGHFGIEEPYSVLLHLSFIWLAVVLALRIRRRAELDRLGAWFAAVVVYGVGTLATVDFFYVVGRYEVDFMAPLSLLGAVGALAAFDAARGFRRLVRILAATLFASSLVASVVAAVLFSLTIYGNFARSNPHASARVERVANCPGYWLDRITGAHYGAMEMDVRFPASAMVGREPLLHTGWYGASDHVFVEFGTNRRFRFGYAHDGGGEVFSDWEMRDGRSHRVKLSLGSLYPPEASPWFAGWPTEAGQRLTRQLRIECDGRLLIESYQRFYPTDAARTWIGEERESANYGTRFTGNILSVQRDPDWREIPAQRRAVSVSPNAPFDRISLTVRLPVQREVGKHDPIVTTGTTGGADFLYLEYVDAERVRFGLEHWGKPAVFSPAFSWRGGESRSIEVHLGSFPGAEVRPDDRVILRVDGVQIWAATARFYRAEPGDVFVGENPLGGTACASTFGGTILNATRLFPHR